MMYIKTNFNKIFLFFNLIILIKYSNYLAVCAGIKTIYYITTEHATISHLHPEYVGLNATFETTRYGRHNAIYYVNIHVTFLKSFDNRIKVDFYFYQFLSNEYRRSFVEMHFRWCDLIHKDLFFGRAMRQGKLAKPCPHPPGVYDLMNMTILPEAIPRSFPFTKGRIYANFTDTTTDALVMSGYVDMELKRRLIKQQKGDKKQ